MMTTSCNAIRLLVFFWSADDFMPVEKKMIDRVGERVKKIGRLQLVSWQAETPDKQLEQIGKIKKACGCACIVVYMSLSGTWRGQWIEETETIRTMHTFLTNTPDQRYNNFENIPRLIRWFWWRSRTRIPWRIHQHGRSSWIIYPFRFRRFLEKKLEKRMRNLESR